MTDIVTPPNVVLQKPSPFNLDGPKHTPPPARQQQQQRQKEDGVPTTITIENCTDIAFRNGIVNIRGSVLFQGKLDDVYLIKYNKATNSLLFMFPNVNVDVTPRMTVGEGTNEMPMIYLINNLPSSFFKMVSDQEATCVNVNKAAFLRFVDGEQKSITVLFSNGVPMSITVGEINGYVRMCEMMEMLNR